MLAIAATGKYNSGTASASTSVGLGIGNAMAKSRAVWIVDPAEVVRFHTLEVELVYLARRAFVCRLGSVLKTV